MRSSEIPVTECRGSGEAVRSCTPVPTVAEQAPEAQAQHDYAGGLGDGPGRMGEQAEPLQQR